jgi:hypothetical protein
MIHPSVKLYRKNQLGIGTWRIWVEGDDKLCYAHATVEGGAEVPHHEIITTNQSGRTMADQVALEMKSRISRQLDKGYKPTRGEAELGSTNQLGLRNPMLAHPIERVNRAKVDAHLRQHGGYVQRKYDGHRALITKQDDETFAYSRRGKLIDTVPHVVEQYHAILPNGVTVDGELYIHGTVLQTLGSIIRRLQPDSAKLHHVWYDTMQKKPFAQRWAAMQAVHATMPTDSPVVLCPTYPVNSLDEAYEHYRHFRAEKYEGAMLRLSTEGYQDAVRANQLLKLKEWQEEEVTVIGVKSSKDGWAVCVCKRDSGQVFDTSAPGSIPEKTEVLENFEAKYKGRRLTVSYAYATTDGLLFHCAALRWHEEI